MTENRVVVGVFAGRTQAYQAINDLHQVGFLDEQIGFITRDESENTENTEPLLDATIQKETNSGAVAGGVVGGLAGAAVALLIPGLGLALAGGILATLGGAAVGAATGGVIGAMIEAGVPEEDARRYTDDVHSGRTIVIVQADNNPMEAFRILKQDHALNPDASIAQPDTDDPEATVRLKSPEPDVTHEPTDDNINV